MFKFFQCWFLKRHPWNKNGTLKFVSPCAWMTAVRILFHARFRGLFKKKMVDSQVRRAIVWLVVFEKAKTSVAIKGRDKVIPCTTLICTKAAAIRPATSYFELFKSSSLKRGMDASPFFCVVRHGRSILSWYSNFRVTRETFTYILHEIGDEISRQDIPVRKAVTPNRRLAIALYYLASTAEYRTIGNLFGVSVALCVPASRKCARLLEIRWHQRFYFQVERIS